MKKFIDTKVIMAEPMTREEAQKVLGREINPTTVEEDTEVDGQHHFCQEFGAELFKDGAKWAINEFLKDLWHPVSEEPEENKKLLVQYTNYMVEDDYEIDMNIPLVSWRYLVTTYNFKKWCYIEDLLPKGGEK